MEDVFSSLIKNNNFTHFMKPYKEDQLIQAQSRKPKKSSSYPIKNFVPVIRPKKAYRKPSPFQLNPDSFDQKESNKKNSPKKNNIELNHILFEKNDLTPLDNSDSSSSEKPHQN